ncbi:hypothetical protein CC85DRAFT_285446 [Cutaneotrichosporon oleaginosum]|uniref:C3H1-type domain-containing protein n=1 Tax=Cutaneotrichosporon oleaginosum TaxID=879819 RepID=A0A0J0XN79_9TREE|nr:uncharacterized protein CC85DRAFT_285446 [Cutaneotrichosporon oleaginosum]KLT42537.1 hypothetical protein CC85DRAFT_285446 [Cutaneotrichosporon oleaginosum]TXT15045.1 hypothetical protein COLE_01238 [Cutaneotrichosporon oleaginosum]
MSNPPPGLAPPAPAPAPKAIPGARPRPIAGAAAAAASPGRSPGSLSTSFRRSRVAAENGTPDDANWRARSVDKTQVEKRPERTVGGFEKSEVRAQPAGASALSTSKGKNATALSHVPCRFFKAGACTAGSSCPFSHDLGGKKEVCQWFLKGDCKFGHKCALAHVRPGEPMSMDRRNKKEQQRSARERTGGDGDLKKEGSDAGTSPAAAKAMPTPMSHPVPIRSALSASFSSSVQSPSRLAQGSSPLREPYGPPSSAGPAGSPSAGFNQRTSGVPFASSPSRPSPLSSSFTNRGAVPSSLKASSIVSTSSPLRPPGAGGISSSFQHASTLAARPPQLSASFADNSLQRNIWARSETPDEPLSPPASRRPLVAGASARVIPDVFDEHDDHGEDLLPSSLSDLLTPSERARRMSRNDSRDGQSSSPGRLGYNMHQYVGAERLAVSAGAALPPGGFLQSLWSQDGKDARETPAELSFGGAQPQPQARTSLLSQQRGPGAPGASGSPSPKSSPSKPTAATAWKGPSVDAPYLMRGTDPSSPSARALSEHAPGQSLPGGIAAALSRMHMQPGSRTPSGLGANTPGSAAPTPKRDDHEDEALFHMDG